MAAIVPNSFSGKKMATEILQENPYARERYTGQGKRGVDREAEKDKLATKMELCALTEEEIAQHRQRTAAARAPRRAMSEEELRDAICAEIQERWALLEEIRTTGKGAELEAQTRAEIAVRLKQMKRLDAILCEQRGGGGGAT